MPLAIDTSGALRTTQELVGLVEAIRDASATEPETDSLEWKTTWDLSDTAVRFHTARHLLGFGNRTVAGAQQVFEGCAYFLAGVEPGNIVGVSSLDPADLENALSRYVAPGQPRWSPHYVTVDGKSVLILAIEAPRRGDPIFALQRSFERWSAGRIFVRRHGKTEEAGPADVRALEARGRAVRPKVELSVARSDEESTLRALRATAMTRDRWVEDEKSRLLVPLRPKPKPQQSFRDPFAAFVVSSPLAGLSQDTRTEAEFRMDVQTYLLSAPVRWQATILAIAVEDEFAPVRLQIVNSTERNFDGVEVVLGLPPNAHAWVSAAEPFEVLAPPDPPKPWGEQRIGDVLATIKLPNLPLVLHGVEVERTGSEQRVRFEPCHVRPGDTVPLPPVYLTLPADAAGEEVVIRWRLTSTGVDSWQEGEVRFDVADEPVDVTAPPGDVKVPD